MNIKCLVTSADIYIYSYGLAGAAVIENTLMVFFGTLDFHTDCTSPLSFRTYTQYFLIPHIASCLIAEDKGIDQEGGWEIMSRSAEAGETLQSLTVQEGLLDMIFEANAKRRRARNIVDANPTGMVAPVKSKVPVCPVLHYPRRILIWHYLQGRRQFIFAQTPGW